MGLNWDWGGFLKGVAGPVSKYLDPSETALREFNQAQIANLEQETAQLRRQNEFWQMILDDDQQPTEVRREAANEIAKNTEALGAGGGGPLQSLNLSHIQEGLRGPQPSTGRALIDQARAFGQRREAYADRPRGESAFRRFGGEETRGGRVRRGGRPLDVAPLETTRRDVLTPSGRLPSRPIPPRGAPPTGLQRPLPSITGKKLLDQWQAPSRPELTQRFPGRDQPRVQQASFTPPAPRTPPPTPAPTGLQAQPLVPSQAQPLGQRETAAPVTPPSVLERIATEEPSLRARQFAMGPSKEGQVPWLAPRIKTPGEPLFTAGVTEFAPRRFEYPDQYDPEMIRKRGWGAGAGMTKAQADLRWGPLEERPEFTTHKKLIEAVTDRAVKIATADPVGVDRWTPEHGQHRAYLPITQMMNAGFLISTLERDPQFAALVGNIPGLSNHLRETQVDPNTRNVQEMSQNQGRGLSPSQIMSEARDRAPSEGGTLSRLMDEMPITGTWVGPMGDINFKTMSAENEKHLAQLGPLSSLVDRIAVLARHINTEDVKAFAQINLPLQTFGQWMGRQYTGWFSGFYTQEQRDQMTTDNFDRYADELSREFDTQAIKEYGLEATDTIRALNRLRLSAAGLFAELGGERGRKTEDDVKRALKMSPGAGETKGMTEFQLDLLYEHLVGSYVMLMTSPAAVLHDRMRKMSRETSGAEGVVPLLQGGTPPRQGVASRDVER